MSLGYCIGNISRIHSFAIIFIVLYEFDSLKWKKNYVKISVEKISWNQFFGLDIYKLIPFSNLLLDVIVIGLKMTSRGLNYPNTKTLPCWNSLPKFEFVRFPSKSLLFIVKIEIMGFLLSDLMELREITLNFWQLSPNKLDFSNTGPSSCWHIPRLETFFNHFLHIIITEMRNMLKIKLVCAFLKSNYYKKNSFLT